jgi:hypothetical protein
MVHVSQDAAASCPMLSLKQVEFNTYSVAGGAHSNNVAEMHKSVFFFVLANDLQLNHRQAFEPDLCH